MKRTAALAALALAACSGPAPAAPVARPAMWRVADRDTTIYLFGSIHALPKDTVWQGPRIARAIATSQGLVLETVLDKDPAKLAGVMARIGVSPGLPPVVERVPADKRARLEALIAKAGVPAAVLDRFETWAVALTLATSGLRELKVSPDDGVETVLRRSFEDSGKPVSGLETPEEQLGYFDGLPEAAQREFLVGVIDDDGGAQAEFDAMIAAWRTGNVRAIAASFDDELKDSAALSDALIKRRNARWADQLAARMQAPGTVFVAVGAGHLAGPGSVEAQLAKRGFRVTRVQ